MLMPPVLAGLFVAVAGVAWADGAAEPLSMPGRVLRAAEFPGFVPTERPTVVRDLAEWAKLYKPAGADAEHRLRREGFVSGVREDLRATTHSDSRGALSVVIQLGSAGAARAELAGQARDFASSPDRGTVKTSVPFAVPGIPGARGFTLTTSDSMGLNIIFADGRFVYFVGAGWGLDAKQPPTRAQVISASTTLYRRVRGRPPG